MASMVFLRVDSRRLLRFSRRETLSWLIPSVLAMWVCVSFRARRSRNRNSGLGRGRGQGTGGNERGMKSMKGMKGVKGVKGKEQGDTDRFLSRYFQLNSNDLWNISLKR